MDLTQVRAAPGVVAVLTAADIPGENNHGRSSTTTRSSRRRS
jgi:xanthine dehydrogenase molybdopterin-binding subunit B